MSFLLGLPIFRGYVKFPGCNPKNPSTPPYKSNRIDASKKNRIVVEVI